MKPLNLKKISDKRYETVMKKLDLKKARPSKKKFIIIQIDSLPYSILKKFLDSHSCKFIRSMLKKGYTLQKFNCGLPTGTPSVQAGMMYGENSMLPAFRFVDKKAKRQFSFGNPNDVRDIETRYFSEKKGILEGGSSYSNIFSGGAERSILTLSTMTKKHYTKRLKETDLWFLLLLYPSSGSRVLYYSITELLIEILSIITYPFFKLIRNKHAIFGFWLPFRRIFMTAILTELITLGAILDIKRGVPKIAMNYINYDEVAHLRGPNSLSAYFMVRALDRRIKRIVKKAGDDYDIFILSDHGQVDGVPFEKLNDMTLAEFVGRCASVPSFGLSSAFEGRLTVIQLVLKKMVAFLGDFSLPLRFAGRTFAKIILKAIKPKHAEFIWKDKEQIFVSDSCCLANVYFNFSEERLDLSEIENKHPRLIEKLIKNQGIGMVLAKEGQDIILFGKGGKLIIGDTVKKEGHDFLKKYGTEDVLIEQLREFNKIDFVGDLVLFGNYEDGRAVSFTGHVGSHGGLGGDMMYPFFISKKKYDLSKVTNAKELYKIFSKY